MGMVIHDDYWEAMKLLPKTQQAPFLMAVVRYGMEGAEPSGRPPWLATFAAIRGRIELGSKRSASGTKGGRKSKQNRDLLAKQNHDLLPKQNGDLLAEQDGFACEANGGQSDKQNQDLLSRVEDEDEIEVEENPPNPPYAEIVGYLNERTGKSFKATTASTVKAINGRLADGYTPDDFKRVIDAQAARWLGDPRMEAYLCPTTLFRPANFEKYLAQAGLDQARRDGYAKYD